MERIQMNLKRLSLTDIVIDINRVPKKKNLIEATDKAVSKPLARNLKVCGNKGVFSSHGDLAEDLSHISDVEVLVLKQRIYGQRKTVREIVGEEQMSLRMVAQQEAFTLVDIFDGSDKFLFLFFFPTFCNFVIFICFQC
ncbi:uncharacterized protein LOC9320241 isoform X1 [Arabidopsis lyrata subsp. lyrata]|nr:uncharacterized protein LOC9327493 isoform X1 [Arabidopsis lyrata subsp. lyrata]XP_020889469.1 uncharacterized protein LOC9320241 isoform X1 [Arabidopsis lyrata subsp. lyrata]|eukprot:XP_020868398.1 uncharacterized protein LOC9327493 isoform X1 [Arabidopsis lyrata subsp. lyrata]